MGAVLKTEGTERFGVQFFGFPPLNKPRVN